MQKILILLLNNWLLLVSISLVLAFVLWQRLPQYTEDKKIIGINVEKTFANLNLKRITNETSKQKKRPPKLITKTGTKIGKEKNNKKTILYFFATWCTVCNLQKSSMEKIYSEMKKENFELLVISEEKPQVLSAYQKEVKTSYPIFADIDGEAHQLFQIKSYPTIIWLEEGKVKDIEHGLNLLLGYFVRYWVKGTLM